ncbi:hypothetical protein VTO42DRAFT_2444 [Malbranchea cinnamomea]
MLQSIRWIDRKLEVLDQLLLPYVESYIPVRNAEDGWRVIKQMNVRGAPAIAIVAMLSLATDLSDQITANTLPADSQIVANYIAEKLGYLVTSRPTAVNLFEAAGRLKGLVEAELKKGLEGKKIAEAFIGAAEDLMIQDVMDNRRLGANGEKWILENTRYGKEGRRVSVLTHCNTGGLATAEFGTALGIIRQLHAQGHLEHAYCTETRPYNQGARLTAFELVHEKIPSTLITDSMAAALMAQKGDQIAAIVVGADRVAANGDTANKIGTYALAVLAKHHGVKFVVAAPRTTIDLQTRSGKDIIIEERPHHEVTSIRGAKEGAEGNGPLEFETIKIAAPKINVWNPAFDVTPAELIDAIVTEAGVAEKDSEGRFHLQRLFGQRED